MAEKSEKPNKTKTSNSNPASEDPGIYGSVIVGSRGQIVIPQAARKAFGIKTGDHLIVLGHPKKGLMLAKAEALRAFAKKLLESL